MSVFLSEYSFIVPKLFKQDAELLKCVALRKPFDVSKEPVFDTSH